MKELLEGQQVVRSRNVGSHFKRDCKTYYKEDLPPRLPKGQSYVYALLMLGDRREGRQPTIKFGTTGNPYERCYKLMFDGFTDLLPLEYTAMGAYDALEVEEEVKKLAKQGTNWTYRRQDRFIEIKLDTSNQEALEIALQLLKQAKDNILKGKLQ